MNPESKGYGNLGWGSPKDLAKTHENEELEWLNDAQGDETGWECLKEWNGPRKPVSNEMGQRSTKQHDY